jgi:hypothetical protein
VITVSGIRTAEISGVDFSSARDVIINEAKSPSVIIQSKNLLYAQMPSNVGSIRSVVVISNRLTRTKRSTIKFIIGDTPSYVSGIERLVQTFLKLLLQTPGTDAFAQNIGGGILGAVAKIGRSGGATSMTADVQLGVDRVRKQLIAIQTNDPALAVSERLLYARLLSAKFSPQEQTLFCRIDIANQASQSTVVGLGV